MPSFCDRLAALIGRDPGARGVRALTAADGDRQAETLARVANRLAMAKGRVGIVTGFPIRLEDGALRPETDGPPGSLFLARVLDGLGIPCLLISDSPTAPLLRRLAPVLGLPAEAVHEAPQGAAAEAWQREFLRSPAGRELAALVAIERVGPSHSRASVARREAEALEAFVAAVPPADWDAPHSMRGDRLGDAVAPLHRLFETVPAEVATLGLGDGGNEIGFGAIPWSRLAAAIPGPAGPRIACRVAAEGLLIGGTSNWAAYALAIATACHRGRPEVALAWSVADERRLLAQMTAGDGGAVDGVTRQPTPTVDGLSPAVYEEVLGEMLRLARE